MRLAASSFYHKPKDKTEKTRKDADLRDKIGASTLNSSFYMISHSQ
jgi:hypothetical protein